MTWVEKHVPCPCGQSSDAYCVDENGRGHCFSCDKPVQRDGGEADDPTPKAVTKKGKALIQPEGYEDLTSRALSEETCRKFGYAIGKFSGKKCHIAPYRDKASHTVAQKVRLAGKKFSVTGDLTEAQLFGQHLWGDGGKRLVITEGEIDALSYAQATKLSWPVVSVPNGAGGAEKSIKKHLGWIESFQEVVFLFDSDEPGQKAANACALLLKPGLAKIAELPLKDANEMLKARRESELRTAVYQARSVRPEGIVSIGDIRDRILAPLEPGLSWGFPTLDAATRGIRLGGVYTFGAGTGIGKTDFLLQLMNYIAAHHQRPVGGILLEQPPTETGRRLAGKRAGRMFHDPDAEWTDEELTSAIDQIDAQGLIYLYDHFGSSKWSVVKQALRHMAIASGCEYIVLDHLTALAAAEEDERRALEQIMAEIAGLAQELNIAIFLVSHLTTPEGKPHEEGGRVMIRHFKGSRAIGYWSHFMFGLERDQQSDDPREAGVTTFRVLKDRLTGQGTGTVFGLGYDRKTGLLYETGLHDPDEDFDDDPVADDL